MPKPLTDIVLWKGRTDPGNRLIPPHLKLAILSRGRILLPARNVQWMLHSAAERGVTWPERLTSELSAIVPEVRVTIELFQNQRLTMTNADIEATLQAYLSLRYRRHLSDCLFLLFAWATHEPKRERLDRLLDVDLTDLYTRPRVRIGPGDARRYILFVYACLPQRLKFFIGSGREPSGLSPTLEGMTSVSTARHLRTDPDPTRPETDLGTQVGHAVRVAVIDKAVVFDRSENKEVYWYKIELKEDLKVRKDGKDSVVAAGRQCWIVRDGLEYVAAPWLLFRQQLTQFETDYAALSLDDRITKLRQWSQGSDLPGDTIIGTPPGTEFEDTLPFKPDEWQIAKDYETVRAPDGRLIEIKHVLSGLDVLPRPEKRARMYMVDVGSNYAVVTWSGDLGAAAADMTRHRGHIWEGRNRTSYAERAEYYFTTRAADWDLLSDVDVWGIDALRSSKTAGPFTTIDSLLSDYYEKTTPGAVRTLTVGRKAALERFFRHYGFTYDYQRDLDDYPVLPKQTKAVNRLREENTTFAYVWLVRRSQGSPLNMPVTDSDDRLVRRDVDAMTELFLYWLEYQAIENGVQMAEPPP